MNFAATLTPVPTIYSTREQLYALCVLLCWPYPMHLSDRLDEANTVTLHSLPKGNTGVSAYLLETNPNAKNVKFVDVASLPYSPIYFEVLGVALTVQFDEDGVGVVQFAEPN